MITVTRQIHRYLLDITNEMSKILSGMGYTSLEAQIKLRDTIKPSVLIKMVNQAFEQNLKVHDAAINFIKVIGF